MYGPTIAPELNGGGTVLEQLTIRDLALIQHTQLTPSPNLTVISGETGGGKTLVVLALRLLRGEKARAEIVRHGAKAASVDGVFRLAGGERSAHVRKLYEEVLGTEPEDGRIVVSRVVDANGRSRARIDGRPVTVRDLVRFGSLLIEIHGQGKNRSLMRAETQTELLDAFAGLTEQREAFASELAQLRTIAAQLQKLRDGDRERRERVEFLRFCLGEIRSVEPARGEHAGLVRDAKIVHNADRLKQTLEAGVSSLHEGGEEHFVPVRERLSQLERDLRSLMEVDPGLGDATRMLEEAGLLIDEVVRELHSGLGRLDLDPERAAAITQRLDSIERLMARFGPGESELFDSIERMEGELDLLEDAASDPEALVAELDTRVGRLERDGVAITKSRRRAAKQLSRAMVQELALLGMERIQVEVRVDDLEGVSLLDRATELGTSSVDVFLAPNPGEPMTPLRETASGGEVARAMLVLKKILADADRVPVLVFDEADAEIGGRLGFAVGRKFREVAAKHQVLCVTHLPQIAAFADSHFLVGKRVERTGRKERTVSESRLLSAEERRFELASMVRGEEAVDDSALAEAERLIEIAGE